jgi:cytochrome c-type biogenesis protein CcmH
MNQARAARTRLTAIVALALSLALPGVASSAEPEGAAARPPAPGELALETRLIAPCCWEGTLDAHASPSAQALPMQIRARLYAGEAPESIEASLVEQYGPRIRASSPGDPLRFVAAAMLAVAALVALGLGRVVRRWRRAATLRVAVTTPAPGAADAYDARLDDELAAID